MPKPRSLMAAVAAFLTVSACDLPTNPDEARERLRQSQEERIVPIQLPMPELSVTMAEQLEALSGIVDTTDLSFGIDPDTFAFGLDSLLALDPVDPDPVVQGYELAIADFSQSETVTVPGVPIALQGTSPQSIPLPGPPLPPASGGDTIAIDLGGQFTTATFGDGSALLVILTTDGSSSLDGVEAYIEAAGTRIADSGTAVDIPVSSTDTLEIPLGSETLPSSFDVILSFTSGSGTNTSTNLTFSTEFANTTVTAATEVDASLVDPVSFTDTVALSVSGQDFSEATMAGGTVSSTASGAGSLEITTTVTPTDLTGLQVGGTDPDQLVITGTVEAPAGATTVDITNTADLTIAFTSLEVETVTLNSVSITLDQTVTVPTGGTLDNLERVDVASGSLRVDVANRLGVSGPVMLVLNGVTHASGATVTETVNLQPSPDNSPVTTPVLIDLAGTTVHPASLAPSVSGTISGTNVLVTADAAADAVTVDPFLDIQPQAVVLSGGSDLNVSLDERVSLAAADVDLGGLGDLLDRIDFNDIRLTLTVANGTGLDLAVEGFNMTVLDASTGLPVTENGDTARVSLSNDDAGTAVLAPAHTATVVEADAVLFVNALLDRIAAGMDVEIAARGSAGPAADSGTIALGDTVFVIFEMELGPDITIDPSGLTFDRVVAEALSLDSLAANLVADLSEDLVSAGVEFEVLNAMPFGLSVTLALASTPADTAGFDPFQAVENIEVGPFAIEPAEVDGEGRVISAVTSTSEVTVNPGDLDLLAEGTLGMGFNAQITGPAGNRAQLTPADSLVIRPLLKIEVRVGGNGGSQ